MDVTNVKAYLNAQVKEREEKLAGYYKLQEEKDRIDAELAAYGDVSKDIEEINYIKGLIADLEDKPEEAVEESKEEVTEDQSTEEDVKEEETQSEEPTEEKEPEAEEPTPDEI